MTIWLLLTLALVVKQSAGIRTSDQPIVVVVSFDGFRYDYLARVNDTPSFTYIVENGVRAEWIEPAFPSLTFPNHHTITTGLYPETHGITANSFYDPVLNDVFTESSTDPKWWDTGVTPLYILNELGGPGRYSGAMMWVGSDSSYHNRTATYVYPYNGTVPFKERVDIVVEWLTDDSKPANAIFLYFQEPDASGHWYGPDSKEVDEQIRLADNVTGYLIGKLRAAGLFERVDLIVTSDHGMAAVPVQNDVDLTEVLNKTYYDDYNGTPVIQIQPRPGLNDKVYDAFKNASVGNHFTTYTADEIPEAYHYRNNLRIAPVILVADLDYQINTSPHVHLLGMHGYNNSAIEMQAFFIAIGPSFKKGHTSQSFLNLDIYPLVSHLLGLVPAPNNGSFDRVQDLLRERDDEPGAGLLLVVVAVFVVVTVSVVLFIVLRFAYRRLIGQERDDETRPVVYFGSLP